MQQLKQLREFVCKECGHTVVVHPDLPEDYVPKICTPCYDKGEPQRQARLAALVIGMADLLRALRD